MEKIKSLLSVISLKVKRLLNQKALIYRWIQKSDPTIYHLKETYFRSQDAHKL